MRRRLHNKREIRAVRRRWMQATASAEESYLFSRSSVQCQRAYLLNEAASLAGLRFASPLVSASLRLRLARPQVGGQLISRADGPLNREDCS
jgi:hypothetical protein